MKRKELELATKSTKSCAIFTNKRIQTIAFAYKALNQILLNAFIRMFYNMYSF